MGSRSKARCRSISVLIGDATPLSCQLLSRALERSSAEFRITCCSSDSRRLVREIRRSHPDVAIVSANLQDGPTGGFKVLDGLRGSGCPTRVIVLLDCPEKEYVLNTFVGGAKGVFSRNQRFEVLRKAIKRVHDGQIWADSSQMELLVEALASSRPLRIVDAKGVPLLTDRENEIANLVATGFSNQEIASRFHISLHTVKNYLFHIYEKLGISSRSELILYALSHQGTPDARHS